MLLSLVIGLPQPNSSLLVSQPSPTSSRSRLVITLSQLPESVCKQMTLSPAFATLTKTRANCTKIVQITPLESALTKVRPVSPLESALTKKEEVVSRRASSRITSHESPVTLFSALPARRVSGNFSPSPASHPRIQKALHCPSSRDPNNEENPND